MKELKDVFKNVDMLHSIGLEAPQGTELLHELAKDGVLTEGTPLTEDEAVEALLKILK